MGKGRGICVIIDMDILNKQCEIDKLCTLIMLAGVAFSQQVFSSSLLSVCAFLK